MSKDSVLSPMYLPYIAMNGLAMKVPSDHSWCARLEVSACQKPPSLVVGYPPPGISRSWICLAASRYLDRPVSRYMATITWPGIMLSRLVKLLLMCPELSTNRSAQLRM
jgi:hypothetical protein